MAARQFGFTYSSVNGLNHLKDTVLARVEPDFDG